VPHKRASSAASVLIVLDGAADRPEAELAGKTPLEMARTPHLDAIAQQSRAAFVDVLPNGGAPQTHSGMLSLLGYPDAAIKARRGSLEASVVFGEMRPGRLYARGNLSSLVDGHVPSRRVNRDVSQAEADLVCSILNENVPREAGVQCRFVSYSTYRLAVEIDLGEPVSDAISGTDPGYAGDEFGVPRVERGFAPVTSHPLESSAASRRSSDAVNNIAGACHAALDGHELNTERVNDGRLPINHVLLRDFGVGLPTVQSFEHRWGVRAKYFQDLPVELGVARYLGMATEEAGCRSVTVEVFRDAIDRVLRDVCDYGLICFHVKGPDEPGHDGDWRAKIRAIETVDQGLFQHLVGPIERGSCRVAVTADHATCWAAGTHTADKVPVIVTGRDDRTRALRFTESACSAAATLPINGAWELMETLLTS
jgi:2,3-bisphosphoglycerate-independent phosphoglycerate mutase